MSEPREPCDEAGEGRNSSWDELLGSPPVVADSNADGAPDSALVDVDQDSVYDTSLIDTNTDGLVDMAVVDANADSAPDAVLDLSAVGAEGTTPKQPEAVVLAASPEQALPGPGFQDPFQTPEANAHIDPSYEMPEYLETASDDEFQAAMQAEEDELQNMGSTPLS